MKRILWRPLLKLRMESLKRSPEAVKSASSCNAHYHLLCPIHTSILMLYCRKWFNCF
ncbi:hypothetical protein cypCar_00012264 [Cyprinus carpio]|nr:hypothetical protein cypCar_00012264 [Cyprinus carpio]